MKARKQIAIYLDYSVRIPNFKATYELFKQNLYKDNTDLTYEDKDELGDQDVRFFWSFEMKNPDVENFYVSKSASKIDDYKLLGNFQPYFYNEIHLQKFLEEYSYNLYSDCEITSLNDLDYINTCQAQLFDVVLIDKFSTVRKISNTCFFVAKSRLYPRNIVFLGPNQEMNHSNFIGVWNPVTNKEQFNAEKSEVFLNWLKDLEAKYNEK